MLLRKLIREMIANENYVYHVSPSSEITKFEPREFWFSDDGTTSGVYTGEETGGRTEKLVYASPPEWAPFYSLPRDTKRAVIPGDDAELIDAVSGMGVRVRPGSMNLLVDKRDIPAMKNHSFTVYSFNKKQFSPLDSSGIEWVSRETAIPVKVERKRNTVAYLEQNGWHVVPVDDVAVHVSDLWDQGYSVNTEGI